MLMLCPYRGATWNVKKTPQLCCKHPASERHKASLCWGMANTSGSLTLKNPRHLKTCNKTQVMLFPDYSVHRAPLAPPWETWQHDLCSVIRTRGWAMNLCLLFSQTVAAGLLLATQNTNCETTSFTPLCSGSYSTAYTSKGGIKAHKWTEVHKYMHDCACSVEHATRKWSFFDVCTRWEDC